MKLKLNRTLRAALIAAITAVGFTLSQAQATDLTKIMTMSDMVKSATVVGQGAKASTVWEIQATGTMSANVVYDFDGSSYLTGISSTDLFSALTGSQYVTVAAWINPTDHAGGAGSEEKGDGGAIFGFGGQNDGIKVIDNNGSLKVTTKGKADFGNAMTSGIDTTADTWQLVAVTYHIDGNNVTACTMVESSISGQQTATSGMATPNPQTLAIGSSNSNKTRELFQGSIAALTVFTSDSWVTTQEVAGAMYAAPTKIVYPTQTWAGTPTEHDWSNAVWVSGSGDPTVFDPKNLAEFTSTGHNEVSITTAASASNVNVGGQDYTFNLSAGGSLTTGTLTVNNDATLALTGTGTVTAATIAATGKTISLAEGVTLQGVSTGAGTLTGAGTFVAATAGNVLAGLATHETDWSGTIDATVVEGGTNLLDLLTNTNIHGGTVQLKSVGSSVSPGGTETALETNLAQKGRTGNFTLAKTTFKTDGAMRFNDWQNNHVWTVGEDSGLQVGGDVWMDHGNKLAISGGDVSIGGKLLLGHSGGSNSTGLVMTDGSLKATTIDAYSNSSASDKHIPVSITGGTVEFTATGNVLQIHNSAVCDVTIGGSDSNDVTLVANSSSWTFAYDGMTVGNVTAQTEEGFTITLGAEDMTAKYTGSLTISDGSSLQLDGTIARATTGSIDVTGALTLTDNVVFDLSNFTYEKNDNTVTYTIFTGSEVSLDGHNYDAENIKGISTSGKDFIFGTDGTISYTVSSNVKVWTNRADTSKWNYEDANWGEGEQFAEGDIAEFNSYDELTVNDDVVAGGILAKAVTFIANDAENPGSLTSPSVEVADGAYLFTYLSVKDVEAYSVGEGGVWAIYADQTLVAGTGSNNGAITVDGGSVTFTGTATAADLAGVTNDGTVSVNFGDATARVDMEDSSGILEVSGGTVDYRSKLGEQTLKLGNGAKLLFGDKDGAAVDEPVFTNDIVLAGDATIQVHGNSKHSSVTISGDVEGAYTLTKADGNQDLTFSGKVNIGGLTTANDGHGTIIFNGGEGSLGKITTNNSITLKFSASTETGAKNEYTFDTLALSPANNVTRWLIVDEGVTVEGTGTGLGDDKKSTIMNSWGLNGGGLEVNGTLTTAGAIGMDAGNTEAHIKGTGLINAGGLDLCNGTTTYIEGGITINITSDTGIYKRNNNGNVQLKDATLQATTVDWAIKDGGSGHTIALADATTGTTFDVADERTITVNHALSGDGKLVKTGAGDLVMTKANSYAGGTVINAGTVKASNDSALGSGNVTIAQDAALEVDAALNLGDRLQSSGSITVNEGKSLTLAEGSFIYETITNAGTVNLKAVTLGEGFEEQGGGDGYFDVAGNKLADDTANHYVGTNESYVQVVDNAAGATSTGTAVWKEQTISLETDGRIVTGSGAPDYDTFYIVAGSENISDIAKNPTTAIEVSAGALVIDAATTGIDITVTDEGTITGEHADATQIGIAKEGWAHYTKPVETSGVKFTAAQDDDVLIVNNGETTQKYTVADRNMAVVAQTLEMTKDDGDVTVSNAVYVDEIVNTTGKVLTLNNVEEVVELTNMNITGSTAELSYVYGEQQVAEATVSISGVLQGGEATLLANLTLKGGSTLDVDGGHVAGGAMNALTLGSTLTFDLAPNSLVNLDQDTIEALAGLSEGQWLDLIVAADGTQLDYVGAETGMSYDQLFRAEGLTGPYTVYANAGSFGLVKGSQVPEPTTGTLSLLALAALAARRRRK